MNGFPPIIAALDYIEVDKSVGLMSRLSDVATDTLGAKIPEWHNQNQALLEFLLEQGRYVVLDTRIGDTVEKMRTAADAYLSQKILPSAITVNPVSEITEKGHDMLAEYIVPLAAEQNVDVIGFTDHNDDLDHRDDHFQERESMRYERAACAMFDAAEIHATTSEGAHFLEARERLRQNHIAQPLIIASKLTENGDEDKPISLTAAHLFGRGIKAIYLGQSLMNQSNPEVFIEEIMEAIQPELQAITAPLRLEI